MKTLPGLFENNRRWAREMTRDDPDFFRRLAAQQSPRYLWIGCSDSRVPANEIVGLAPGELFVHRNVANRVGHTDFNCLSVLQYAVDVLRVEHVIVCGHYGCGGVAAALSEQRHGLVDNWIEPIRAHYARCREAFPEGLTPAERIDRMCELNVAEQVRNVCRTTVVRDAWARGQRLVVHGWIYSLRDGLLHDLGVSRSGAG
ncbi:MAG TPA: carbonate dehydratase [Chromatiales bacterium]|nr:carbonate dehydratase [Chromatiales bacterium]